MEKSKILLEKTEFKKISKRYKLDTLEKESGKLKSEPSVRNELPKKHDLSIISPETYQDLIKIYPKNTETVSSRKKPKTKDRNPYEKRDVSAKKKSDLRDFQFESKQPSGETASSNSSVSSVSSFIFLETESSVQTLNYDKLTEESDTSFKEESDGYFRELDTESQKKLLCDSSDISFYNESIYDDYIPQKDIAGEKMNVQNSVREEEHAVDSRYFDEDVKCDDGQKSVHLGQESTFTLIEEDDALKELRDVLDKSINCFVRYLKNLQNTVSKQEKSKKSLRKNNSVEFDRSTPEYNCADKYIKTLKTKRDDNSFHVTLPKSSILKSKSDTDTKKRIGAVAFVNHSPRSIHTDSTISEHCSCNCCTRKCFHYQSTRRILSNNVLEVNAMSKKKMTANMSQGDFANNVMASDACMEISQSNCVNNEWPSDLPVSVNKETGLVKNDTELNNLRSASSKPTDLPNAGENKESFEFCSTIPGEINQIKNPKNEECRYKKKNKTKIKEICGDSNQSKKSAESNSTEDNDIDWDVASQLFLAFLFVMCIIFFFIFVMFIFIR